MSEIITSLQNPQVKIWRSLNKSRAARVEHGLFLAEGEHMAGEAVKEHKARALLMDRRAREKYSALADSAQGVSVYVLSEHVMAALCDAKTPQGIIAVCGYPRDGDVPLGARFLLALDGVQDPGNVGTLIRTMDAAGFQGLLMDEKTADPYGPKALRASMGAAFRVPVWPCDLPAALARLSPTHDLYAGALDGAPFFDRCRGHAGVCIIIGNEGAGISPAVYAVPGIQKVKLPMRGGAESLNASVAGAIMIYDIVRCGK